KNAQALSKALTDEGIRIVSGGTDNHLVLLDVSKLGLTGKDAEAALDGVGITTNKNTIPYDQEGHFVTSGVRVGTAAVTTRGFKEQDILEKEKVIALTLNNLNNQEKLKKEESRIAKLTSEHQLYV